jgi:molybdenum cofactor synthesis domain-containing protein
MGPRSAAVVTASDGVAHGTRDDESGAAVEELLRSHGFRVLVREVVPDDGDVIRRTLARLAAEGVALVAVTGGTGLGPRDVTPEATRAAIDREVPGLAEAMRAAGRRSTPMADLSRAVVGLRGATLIVDLPGSPRGATESLAAIVDLLPHALDLAAGDTREHPPGHGEEGAPVGRDDHHHGGHGHHHGDERDAACDVAHGDVAPDAEPMTLVAVYATGVSRYLLHWGRELGYRTVLVEPETDRVSDDDRRHADAVVASPDTAGVDATADVVVTDHHRDDLADLLAAVLGTDARWIGLMGSPRHAPPHVEPLRERGFDADAIARVQRPIGLDIGSRTPSEIALATLAGLVADRKGRAGGVYAASG